MALKIIITGNKAEGKTILMHEIAAHLRTKGITVESYDDGHLITGSSPSLEHLPDPRSVTIETTERVRDPSRVLKEETE